MIPTKRDVESHNNCKKQLMLKRFIESTPHRTNCQNQRRDVCSASGYYIQKGPKCQNSTGCQITQQCHTMGQKPYAKPGKSDGENSRSHY